MMVTIDRIPGVVRKLHPANQLIWMMVTIDRIPDVMGQRSTSSSLC